MVKCESLRMNMYRITHTGKVSKFSRNTTISLRFIKCMNTWKRLLYYQREFMHGNAFY